MIRIHRGPAPGLRVFTACDVKAVDGIAMVTRAEHELQRAIAFFTNRRNYANEKKLTKRVFPFHVYKNAELAAELERVFGNKCAYCESRFAHVTPRDIEHFRPKSEITIDGGKLTPGYYWLAGEWDNLLVSCPDCNRGRNFEVPGQPALVRLGKSSQFPLEDEAKRIRGHDQLLEHEEGVRLLINPCEEEPADYVVFTNDGLIQARPDATGRPCRKGEVSIAVYALQRKPLVEERLRVLNDFIFKVDQLRRAVENYNSFTAFGDADGVSRTREQISDLKRKIKGMLSEDAPYLGMLRGWIRREKHARAFADLELFKIDLEQLI
jgi:uncharacterized protein (TIGR02646 family)